MTRQRQSYAQFPAIVATCGQASDLSRLTATRSRRRSTAASRGKSKSGNSVLKHKIALCAGLVAALAVSGHALAQPAPPLAYPGAGYPIAGLPPHEIVTIVRSAGLEPLGSPVRQGPAYALRAVDPAGEEVRVIVDAQRGRIVKVIPLMAPRYAMPLMRPPYGRPPRPIAMVPEGYGPYPPGMARRLASKAFRRTPVPATRRVQARRPIRRLRRRCRDRGPSLPHPIHRMPSPQREQRHRHRRNRQRVRRAMSTKPPGRPTRRRRRRQHRSRNRARRALPVQAVRAKRKRPGKPGRSL